MYRSLFNDFEGFRVGLLKSLAELGEAPAFIRRAQAVDEAWTQLCDQCRSKRKEMLRWPWMHLRILADRLNGDWSRLAPYLADKGQAKYFEDLYGDWKSTLESKTTATNSWLSIQRILADFVDSADRFNANWSKFLRSVNLEEINQLRCEYNKHYPVEKACAFDSEDIARLGFTPLDPITPKQLAVEFPTLAIPELRGH